MSVLGILPRLLERPYVWNCVVRSNVRGLATAKLPDSGKPEVETSFFDLSSGARIAYKKSAGTKHPGIIYLPGFLASMTGEKANILDRYASRFGHPFVRFDYRGVGESTGELSKMLPSMWIEDILTVLDTLTDPAVPQILVGSSMGAFLMMHVAVQRPTRIQGLIGVNTPNISDVKMIVKDLSRKEKERHDDSQKTSTPPDQHSKNFQFTNEFIESGLKLSFSKWKSIPVHCPVRLLHGVQDTEVPWEDSVDVMNLLESTDTQLILSKSSDHRFSRPEDLQMLVNAVDQVVKAIEFPQ